MRQIKNRKVTRAKLNKSDAKETDDFICFHGHTKNEAWVNAEKQSVVESSGTFPVIVIASFCGDNVPFGPKNARKLANKILKWCGEIDEDLK